MNIDENKVADLKATIEKLNKQLVKLTTPQYEYPVWFKNNRNNMIVKFTALNTGIVISVEVDEGYRIGGNCNSWQPHTDIDVWTQVPEPVQEFAYPMWFSSNSNKIIVKFTLLKSGVVLTNGGSVHAIGDTSDGWYPHTDITRWTQIPEPQPTEWEPRGGEWSVRSSGDIREFYTDDDSRLFGTEYRTKEQAKWAMDKMRSFNRLLAYVAEFDVDKNGKQWEANWTNVYNNKCSIRYCHITNKWYLLYHTTMQYFTTYMSAQCAELLVKKLNNGEVEL